MGSRTRSRSPCTPAALLLQQQENLAMLTEQCRRGELIAAATAEQLPGPIRLRRRIEAVETAWQQSVVTHTKLLRVAEDAGVTEYLENKEFPTARAVYLTTLENLDALQDRVQSSRPPDPETAPDAASSTTPPRTPALERIPVPSFDGDAKDWPTFKDMFTSMVVNDASLCNVYKFYYLKRALKGNAFSLIKNITVTNDNFNSAWKIVTDYYQDVQVLTFSYLVQLLKLEPVSSGKATNLERLILETREILTSLESLGEPVKQWGSILVVLTLLRLDSDTRKDWERSIGKRKCFPKYSELEEFLQARVHAESVASIKSGVNTNSNANPMRAELRPAVTKVKYNSHVTTPTTSLCLFCKAPHALNCCKSFAKLSSEECLKKVRSWRACYNCLRTGHFPNDCRNKDRCSQCSRRHHSLLHESLAADYHMRTNSIVEEVKDTLPAPRLPSVSSNTAAQMSSDESKKGLSKSILLATALVRVSTQAGRVVTLRALIDQGSERSLMSESAAQALRVVRKPMQATLVGIGGQPSGCIKSSTTVHLTAVSSEQQTIEVNCLIFNKLTSYLPRRSVERKEWPFVNQLPLADTEPTSTKTIDLLLGADVYGDIIRDGILRFPNEPVAQCTIFGWILSGPYSNQLASDIAPTVNAFHVVSNVDLNETLNKFWEVEDIPKEQHLSADDQACEDLFVNTTFRDNCGRYHVSLPFKTGPPLDIGESYTNAHSQYLRLERRLSRNSELSQAYHAFLSEYRDLGHMTEYFPSPSAEQVCFIPHHPVVKASSSTTKVRVVFNASSPTTNGKSLNDNMFTGRKLQQDLPSILMRWRMHRYVLVADAEKMFRQIRVVEDHSRYQLILWRPEQDSSVKIFRLTTVTYGTASAPYLALRVLNQLAEDERQNFPLAAEELVQNTYVDDVLFGASSLPKARLIRDQLMDISNKGGFSLRKWSSNSEALLSDLPVDQREATNNREFSGEDSLKILGISWTVLDDCFRFAFNAEPPVQYTKRSHLSFISKLFDPLGWVSPVIVAAKIFMQQLWLTKLDWDTPLPSELVTSWSTFTTDLLNLPDIRIPRWLGTGVTESIQVHAFCDASQLAYAAAVYLRVNTAAEVQTNLLISKSKVAPLKTLTVPRLELCAAELLSRLLLWVIESLKLNPSTTDMFAWSDSTVTLAWIAGDPSRWKVFVANRVSRIQNRLKNVQWKYVPTECNPADLASRGTSSLALQNSPLWWYGPAWLQSPVESWPAESQPVANEAMMEERSVAVHVTRVESGSLLEIAQRSSDWGKLVRAAAVFVRYREILRARSKGESVVHIRTPSSADILHYRKQARIFWLKTLQSSCFADELSILRKCDSLPRGNRLISLDPYMDEDGLLRVGGRLDLTSLSADRRHPLILGKHYLTRLIIRQAHQTTLHGGMSLTMRYLAESYWILRAKILVQAEIHKCVPCARNRAMLSNQRMAPLPVLRTERHRPFQHVGVDYAGPISVRTAAGRGHKSHKAYIAVFVCMTVRAIHIELVHDYSTLTFLAAFKRFCARRGLPSIVVSDNGTTFRGASNELKREFNIVITDPRIAEVLARDQIEWQFIPPGAPHFGGIWEAGVKSIKYHLRRVAGDHTFTSEEFTTLLCQVEACLNSRPIARFSSSPDDLSYLTPGHFLIGSTLISPPEHSALGVKSTHLTRWKLIQNCLERFWKTWSHDYLRALQTRTKWRIAQPNLKVGDIVLIQNDNLPPTKWELARILTCYPGKDGVIRVCQLKTATAEYVRPIHRLCLLPVASEDRDSDTDNAVF